MKIYTGREKKSDLCHVLYFKDVAPSDLEG